MNLSTVILALALAAKVGMACEENDCAEEESSAVAFQCFSRGHCMDSSYLDAVAIEPEEENKARHCQELCMEAPGCTHFTLELDSNICVLLEDCGQFAYGKAVTGQD